MLLEVALTQELKQGIGPGVEPDGARLVPPVRSAVAVHKHEGVQAAQLVFVGDQRKEASQIGLAHHMDPAGPGDLHADLKVPVGVYVHVPVVLALHPPRAHPRCALAGSTRANRPMSDPSLGSIVYPPADALGP